MNKSFFQKDTKIDISRFIEDGHNTIIFHPTVCPLNMYIELVEKQEKPVNIESDSEMEEEE